MDKIVSFVTANSSTVLWVLVLAAALAIAAYAAIRLGYKKQVAAMAYRFVCSAENQIKGTKMGQERKAQVLAWLHDCLPFPVTLFVTEADLDRIIESAVAKMKEALLDVADGDENTETTEAAALTGEDKTK